MLGNLENSAAAIRLKKVSFHSNPKECSNYHTTALILYVSKEMLKILQTRLKHTNREIPGIQAGFRKGRGTKDQISNIDWITKKGREFQKNIYFCFIDYAQVFHCVVHNKLWTILKQMGISDYLTCLLRNLYADQEATEPHTEQRIGSKL